MPKKKYKDVTAEELVKILKWTPRTYTVQLYAYGGETYAGRVDRKIYDFFRQHRIDIEEYASDWDDSKWDFVPEDLRPFPPGSAYECGDIFHCSGATMDSSNMVEVLDENNNTIWSCSLDPVSLSKEGVDVECFGSDSLDDQPEGTIIFTGGQGEKGTLFGGSIDLKEPFDPKKLRITYEDCDGWPLANSVSYDDEDISNDDYSTTGKWSDAKWYIVGGEEVYEGIERDDEGNPVDDISESEPEENSEEWDAEEELGKIEVPKIQWYDVGNPSEPGEYHVLIDAPWPNGGLARAEWTGKTWKQDGKKVKITQWGTDHDAWDIPVLENEETWASRVIDDDMKTRWWPGDQKPVHKGEYEVIEQDSSWPFPLRATWTGRTWKDADGKKARGIQQWRGLKFDPSTVDFNID